MSGFYELVEFVDEGLNIIGHGGEFRRDCPRFRGASGIGLDNGIHIVNSLFNLSNSTGLVFR